MNILARLVIVKLELITVFHVGTIPILVSYKHIPNSILLVCILVMKDSPVMEVLILSTVLSVMNHVKLVKTMVKKEILIFVLLVLQVMIIKSEIAVWKNALLDNIL